MLENKQENREYYLKSSIRLEPHVWGWYAWPQLISPMTASLNIINRNLKLMESFVAMPEIHKMAATNRALMGGAFIDLDESYTSQVQKLIDDTKIHCKDLINLAYAINECDSLLKNNADGHTLEHIYPQIPSCLRGKIELVYDANNHPMMRFIEPLFYDEFYDTSYQSVVLCDTTKDHRPFVLSTPKMLTEGELQLNIPFADKKIDFLAKLRFNPRPLNEIFSQLNISVEDQIKFKSMLTTTPPTIVKDNNYQGDGVRVRYLGHACILLESKQTKVLIDPVISYQYDSDILRYTLNDVPDSIDYVLFTHTHDDHVLLETLLQLRFKTKNFVFPSNNKGFLLDPSLKLILNQIGFNNLIPLEEFDVVKYSDGEITGIPFLGEHCDLNIHSKMAYHIKMHNTTFLFAADSNNLETELYRQTFNKLGNVDVLYIGMECVGAPLSWLYGPLLTYKIKNSHDQSRRLSGSNCTKALDIVHLSKASNVYIYAMGQEPWLNYIMALDYTDEDVKSIQISESDELVQACLDKGIESERLYLKKEWHF